MSTPAPRYDAGAIPVETREPTRHLLVLDIGIESYFLRLVSGREPGEPPESAWAIPGCDEAATQVVVDPASAGPA